MAHGWWLVAGGCAGYLASGGERRRRKETTKHLAKELGKELFPSNLTMSKGIKGDQNR